jgi:PAS domain S-box-containing protein
MSTATRKHPAKAKAKAKASRTATTRSTSGGGASTSPVLPTHGGRTIRRELEVHREELATQNEELRRANAALMNATERYAQLYDGAPIAYFTLDERGMVVEANLAGAELLQEARHFLFGRSFDERVAPSSRKSFRDFRARVLETGNRAVHETALAVGADRVHVRIEAARLTTGPADAAQCLICVIDVTKRRQLSELRRAPPHPRHANDVISAERGSRGRGLVLVVDDDGEEREMSSRVLESVGFDVCHARDGIDALDVVRRRSKDLFAVLFGLTTPPMGPEVAR